MNAWLAPLLIALKRLPQHRFAMLGGILLIFMIILALAAPWIEQWLGVDAEKVNLFERFKPPSSEHPLGTDELGRDLLVRLLYGVESRYLSALLALLLPLLLVPYSDSWLVILAVASTLF